MAVPETRDIYNSIDEAYGRISPHIRRTPLEHSLILSNLTKCHVYLKLESEQLTGSFKVRGAFNKLKICCENGKGDQQFVTASTGNHGMASALALKTLNQTGTVYVPTHVSEAKERFLKLYDIEVKKYGSNCLETEQHARKMAEASNAVYISPYADLQVIYGQGTVGKEILEDLPDVDVIFVAVGGGGLIAGIAAYAKHLKKSIEIVGCEPENSPGMTACVEAGKIVEIECLDTLSDATAGGVEPGSVTFPLCKKLVDKWIKVSEDEIARAMYLLLEQHHKLVEGSAGVALAALMKCYESYAGKKVALVMCGANISMEKLKFVIKTVEDQKK